MRFSFDNKALRSRVWEGNVQYVPDRGTPVLGKLVISSDSFTFRRPKDPYGFPMLGEKIPARTDAISFNDSGVVLRCEKGTYAFELFPSSLKGLKEWYIPKTETLKVVTSLDGSFLGNYNAYPHPFAETHSGEGQDKDQIYQFLRDCIPALKEPIKWGLDDVTFRIEEGWTECHISEWNYVETKNEIRIDCDRYECGFFDDSEQGMKFSYEISYLGAGRLSRYAGQTDNEKLNHRFLADWYASPKVDGAEDFIAENPFGLNGFYRIKWSLHYR